MDPIIFIIIIIIIIINKKLRHIVRFAANFVASQEADLQQT